MEFDPELCKFQGALMSVNNIHPFSEIKHRGGNEEKILDIITRLFQFLQENNYLNQEGITKEGQSQMRIYCFYLVLNSDLPILDDLIELPGIANVIWTVPKLSKCLLTEIIWGLGMEDYLSEILINCDPILSLQLLKIFTAYIKHSTPTKCLNQIRILSKSCYRLICRLHFYGFEDDYTSRISSEIYEHFLISTNCYTAPPNLSKLNKLSNDELFQYKGHNLDSLLTLTIDSLKHFMSHEKFYSETFHEFYLSTMESDIIHTKEITSTLCDSQNKWILEYLHKCHTTLLDSCQALVMETSVEIFCAWSEFEENGKSMQQNIGELCYFLLTRMEKLPSLLEHPLLKMLPQLSRKPTDVHDIIKISDNDTLVENANKLTPDQEHWLQAIIDKQNFTESKCLLQCLIDNIQKISISNCKHMFKTLSKDINESNPNFELIKLLAIKTFSKLDNDTKSLFLSEYFPDRVVCNSLQVESFHDVKTELFNKFIAFPDTNLGDIYNVFIQNPLEVYTQVIRSATDNCKQCDLMTRIMTMLEPFGSHYYITDTDPTIVKAIEYVSQNSLETDIHFRNFTNFLINIKKCNVLSGTKLLMLVIMPGLHRALLNKNYRLISVEVKLLKDAYEVDELLQYRAPLLVMISQILEAVRWNFSTFSPFAPDTLEVTLDMQMKLFGTYQAKIPDKDTNWLKSKLKKLQPLNMYYYKEIWNPPGTDFLGVITGQQELNRQKLVLLVAKILCKLTPREWGVVWRCLTKYGEETAIDTIHHALILMTVAVESKRDDNTWPCLLYCYSNYVLIVKTEFFKEPLSTNYVNNIVEKLVTLINKHRSEDATEVGTVLLPLFSYIASQSDELVHDVRCTGNKIKHPAYADIINTLFHNVK